MIRFWKSKTIDFNILIAALAGMAAAFGIQIPEQATGAVLVLGNIILRAVTKEPLANK